MKTLIVFAATITALSLAFGFLMAWLETSRMKKEVRKTISELNKALREAYGKK